MEGIAHWVELLAYCELIVCLDTTEDRTRPKVLYEPNEFTILCTVFPNVLQSILSENEAR
jgi:hypothetical protein